MKYERRKSERSLRKVVLRGFVSDIPAPEFSDRHSPINEQIPEHIFSASVLAPALHDTPLADPQNAAAFAEEGLPEAGAVVDKFRLEKLLGIGAFAVVYRCTHMPLAMPVALKFLRPNLAVRKPELVRQLHIEAQMAARINHANVVRILDVCDDPALSYVVMEYVDGESLAAAIAAAGSIAPVRAIKIGIDAARGLAAGAAACLVHRDVKPANILLSRNGDVKIADFGLAVEREGGVVRDGLGTRDSGARSMVGTPAYMAPEQILGTSQLDARADVYALGATLYHALTGVPPYQAEDVRSLLRMKQHTDAPDVRVLLPSATSQVSAVIGCMLNRDRDQRFLSMDAACRALEGAHRSIKV
jgi:eukaryotic-like serine/threonine-protein kinase